MITLSHYVVLGAVLFCIGLYGALSSRSALRLVACVELMLNAVNVNVVSFALFSAESPLSGVSAVVLLIVVGAAEIGVALALIVALTRAGDISHIDTFTRLREAVGRPEGKSA